MKITQINKLTGEVVEFNPKSPVQIVEAYRQCSETIKAYEAAKKELAKLVEPLIGSMGVSEVYDGYMFRSSPVQRTTYDKAVLRQVIKDEDALDLMLEPNKTAVDAYIKLHLNELGENSTVLRKSMIPVGKPYSVLKLEKV